MVQVRPLLFWDVTQQLMDCLTLEDGTTDWQYQNFGKQQPKYTV
jgi:hypothetical protein